MGEKGLTIAPIFGDGMILQRDTYNRIYGKETMASTVSVLFQDTIYSADVDCKNNFTIELPPVKAGGPYSMKVMGSSEIVFTDILFGDVYLLSGQSNMELPLQRVLDVSGEEIEQTCEPTIRQYLIPASYNFAKSERFMYPSTWKKAEGEDLLGFSALGYFFAKEIKENCDVPVGLVMTAVGGSKIESWMSHVALSKFGDYELMVEVFKDKNYFQKYLEDQQEVATCWQEKLNATEVKLSSDEDYKEWKTCNVPSLASEYIDEPFCGSLFLSKEVKIEGKPSGEGFLYMGTLINSDIVYINGVEVGRTDYRYPPRRYKVPEGILQEGSNLIQIRLVISEGNGGAVKNRPYYLSYHTEESTEKITVDLTGEWYYRVGKKMDTCVPNVIFPPLLPIGFFNTVVKPMSKLSVKGVLWYQGESNTGDSQYYADKFSVMVNEWRELFGVNLPFIYVQLSNYQEELTRTTNNGWAWLREEQRRCLEIDNVAMAVSFDIGEANDLHPQNKKELGKRIALAARKLIYKEDIGHSGPTPNMAYENNGTVTITFDHLEANNEEVELNNFELAGEDKVFYMASARKTTNEVIVTSEEVTEPSYVRYAWCDSPNDLNFYNEHQLPCCGFMLEVKSSHK